MEALPREYPSFECNPFLFLNIEPYRQLTWKLNVPQSLDKYLTKSYHLHNMPGPRIVERYKYMTVPQAAKRIGLHQAKLRRRLKDELLPPPTYVNEYGLKFFDEDWVTQARIILDNSFEGGNADNHTARKNLF